MSTNDKKTMAEEWKHYIGCCFPDGFRIPPPQEMQLQQAFFAGALVTLYRTLAISDLPEAEAMKKMSELHDEIFATCADRIKERMGRN